MKLAGRLCHNDAAMTAAFVLASTALERISGLGRWLCGFGYGTGTGFESRGRVMALESPESGLVLISVVPHCTQAWVTSSRSSDSAPLAYCTGATAVIAIRFPQCGQGRRKLGKCDAVTPL